MTKTKANKTTVGILGGGQLGRMLLQEAINLDIDLYMLDPSPQAPCSSLAPRFYVGDFNDHEEVIMLGEKVDVLTVEIEHVSISALEELESKGKAVYPSSSILKVVQDKGLQKEFYKEHGIPTAPFRLITKKDEIHASELPKVLKMRRGGYDGKGVQLLRNIGDLETAFDQPAVLEDMVDFAKELSVIVARNPSGDVRTFPVVEMEFNHEANLVEFLFAPADISDSHAKEADRIAREVADAFGLVGLLAVELFLTKEGKILVNEVAPRPHNSGHQTIEGNYTSQYAQHLRAILDYPLGNPATRQPSAMVNLLGEEGFAGPVQYVGLKELLKIEGVYPHIYGKTQTKPYRKMGHVTILDDSIASLKKKAAQVKQQIRVISS